MKLGVINWCFYSLCMQGGLVKANRRAEVALDENGAIDKAAEDEGAGEDDDADGEVLSRQEESRLSPYAHLSAAIRELQDGTSAEASPTRADAIKEMIGQDSLEYDQLDPENMNEEDELKRAIAGVRFIAGHQRVEEEIQQVCSLFWKNPLKFTAENYGACACLAIF